MPKKFKGENSKAAEARARKEEVRVAEQQRKQKEADDAYWADDDKHINRKLQRKEEKEKKQQEKLMAKQEKQKLYEDELQSMRSAKPVSAKVTRAEIEANKLKMEAEARRAAAIASGEVDEDGLPPIAENLNRMVIEGDEARNVEEAISVLGNKEKVDMHPEKRMKAAYAAFEAEQLEILKKENPNLRLSQIKQMIKKDWQKSPQNPMIQAMQAARH